MARHVPDVDAEVGACTQTYFHFGDDDSDDSEDDDDSDDDDFCQSSNTTLSITLAYPARDNTNYTRAERHYAVLRPRTMRDTKPKCNRWTYSTPEVHLQILRSACVTIPANSITSILNAAGQLTVRSIIRSLCF